MARVSKSGRMEASMRATGETTWPTEEGVLFTPMETFTKVNGSTIRLMAVEPMSTWTVLSIPESGERTSSTVSALRPGLMEPNMKATTSMERSMVLVLSSGPTVQCTLGSFIITTFMEKEFTLGLMAESTKANGVTTRCTAKELSPGLMVESMLESMLTTRSKVTESSCGLMVVAIRVTGKVASSMARVFM